VNLVVIGDVLCDVDLLGEATRLCPDAPAPVLELERTVRRAGGAGLAATVALRDAAATGNTVTLVTVLADDEPGDWLRRHLGTQPNLQLVAGRCGGTTPVKTRLRSNDRSLARIDTGAPGRAVVSDDMLDAVCRADMVLVSDYGRGITADRRLRAVLAHRAASVVWDPHPRGSAPVAGSALVTPSLAEACGFAELPAGPNAAARAAVALRERWQARAVAVTAGADGVVLDAGRGTVVVPAPRVDTVDPCGAGDRFAVSVAAALMAGVSTPEAVWTAVEDAARFLRGGGTSSLGEDTAASTSGAVDHLGGAEETVRRVRAAGGTVVATGGCFDLLHAGHVRTLRAARELGDCLVVCLNSDDSVRRLKGPSRPINPVADRAELLRSLSCVDEVLVFDEDDPRQVLSRLRPDVWVKGADYVDPAELPETPLLRLWNGRVVLVPHHDGRSTTRLVSRAAEAVAR